jgi:putative phosphoribosyl transferase
MSATGALFADRRDAGRQLAAALRHHAGQDAIVLALPRGGVPVAFEVAEALDAPLDLLFVRKIGLPGHEEFGIGAVVDGADPQTVLNHEAEQLHIPASYIEAQTARELREIERRRAAYLDGRQPLSVRGRNVILVDDGIATGGTVRAALQGLEKAGVGHLTLAVPVAPQDTLATLRGVADDLVCLATPDPFYAVGLYYRDFTQTEDAEVVALLDRARRRAEPGQ